MPRIIAGLRGRFLSEAERQLVQNGYSGMTIRSVARECHVAVGTVYNYFSSKEEFAASVLLVRWKRAVEEIEAAAATVQNPEDLLRSIYEQLTCFMDQYRVLFQDESAISVFTASLGRYHDLLRNQLAQPLRAFCQSDFEAEFAAEALLTWTVAGEGFDEIYQVMQKLFK